MDGRSSVLWAGAADVLRLVDVLRVGTDKDVYISLSRASIDATRTPTSPLDAPHLPFPYLLANGLLLS